jgi:hypothetical protein
VAQVREQQAAAAQARTAAAQPTDDVPAGWIAPVVPPVPHPLAAPDPLDGDHQEHVAHVHLPRPRPRSPWPAA